MGNWDKETNERGNRRQWEMEKGNVKRHKRQREENKGEGTNSQRTKNCSQGAGYLGKQMRERDNGNGKCKKVRGQDTQRTRARWIETMLEGWMQERGPRKQEKENRPGLDDKRDRERETKNTKYKGKVASDTG